nr:ribonuclease H-like domain-containing protein [Tanacetum cinerariifolium]
MQGDEVEPSELQEVVGGVTTAKLITEVVTAASATINAIAPQLTTAAAPTLTTAPSAARRRKGAVIREPEEVATPSTIIHSEAKSKDKWKGILVEDPKPLKKQAQIEQDKAYARELEVKLNKNIDWDEVIDHVHRKEKEDNDVKRYQALKRKPQTEAQSRKNMMIYLRNVAGFKMDYFKGMTYDDIRPIFEKNFNSNVAFLLKTKEKMDEEDSRALKRLSESQEDKATKKQKLDKEVEELRKHLMIVPNEDDDVYTKATPLALKVPVVDYEIYTENNKPYYKIKRADGSHQLYLSYFSMLKNFDKEDLEVLWQLVKERFASTKPKNFSDDFLLTTLGAMFEKPDIQAQIWKNRRSVHGLAKVKSWKPLESCGVQIIIFTTTQLILLVERKYPLTRNKTDLEEFNSLKIYEAGVKSSSSVGTSTQNITFVSSSHTDNTNEPISAAASVFTIDADDLEEMDLKWQMAMLTKGHFARECRSPKDTRRNGVAEPRRRNVPVETTTSSALVFQCDVSCSKACTKAYAKLQSHYDKLTDDYRKSQFDVISYKIGLKSVEVRLLVYQQNEYIFEEDIKLLKLEVKLRDNALVVLRQNLEKAKQERDDLKLKLEKFQTSSKNLSELLASQTNDKTGDGYHAVPLPYTGTFMPPKPDLVFHNAPNDVKTDHPAFNVELSPTKPDNALSHTHRPSAPIIEDWVSDSEDEFKTKIPHNFPSFLQPTEQVKFPRPSVKHVEIFIPTVTPKTVSPKPTSNGNRRNRKACFVDKSLTHLIKDCDYHEKKKVQTPTRSHAPRGHNKQYARMLLSNPQKHVVPTTVLTQSKLVLITAVRLINTAVPKTSVTRPRQAKTVVTKPNSPPRRHINLCSRKMGMETKMPTFRPCFPQHKCINDPQKGNPQHALKDKRVLDSGCSRHTTGNMSYLSDFKELNGGYVAFGGNPKGGKIFGKGKIRTGKLDFDDVYCVKELKFNIFSVSQMCDKKNSVLFTDTECLVLSPDFKLSDENQVLLRVPRETNMYNVYLKNIVPSGDLTCLFAKATLDESNLWHKRLGHINFKTMNKLVKVNKKRVIIMEATIRDALRFDNAEGVECLPNEEIFTELARMGTSWNKFSSSMASAVICLSTGDLSLHSTKYSFPALTHKVFANMRRVGKGFSRVDTPLFKGIVVEQPVGEGAPKVNVENVSAGVVTEGAASVADDDVNVAVEEPSIPSPTPPTPPPQPLQDQPSTSQVQLTPPQSPQAQPPSPQHQP